MSDSFISEKSATAMGGIVIAGFGILASNVHVQIFSWLTVAGIYYAVTKYMSGALFGDAENPKMPKFLDLMLATLACAPITLVVTILSVYSAHTAASLLGHPMTSELNQVTSLVIMLSGLCTTGALFWFGVITIIDDLLRSDRGQFFVHRGAGSEFVRIASHVAVTVIMTAIYIASIL